MIRLTMVHHTLRWFYRLTLSLDRNPPHMWKYIFHLRSRILHLFITKNNGIEKWIYNVWRKNEDLVISCPNLIDLKLFESHHFKSMRPGNNRSTRSNSIPEPDESDNTPSPFSHTITTHSNAVPFARSCFVLRKHDRILMAFHSVLFYQRYNNLTQRPRLPTKC